MRTIPDLGNRIVAEVSAALYHLMDYGSERVERKVGGFDVKVVAYRMGRDFRVDIRPSEAFAPRVQEYLKESTDAQLDARLARGEVGVPKIPDAPDTRHAQPVEEEAVEAEKQEVNVVR